MSPSRLLSLEPFEGCRSFWRFIVSRAQFSWVFPSLLFLCFCLLGHLLTDSGTFFQSVLSAHWDLLSIFSTLLYLQIFLFQLCLDPASNAHFRCIISRSLLSKLHNRSSDWLLFLSCLWLLPTVRRFFPRAFPAGPVRTSPLLLFPLWAWKFNCWTVSGFQTTEVHFCYRSRGASFCTLRSVEWEIFQSRLFPTQVDSSSLLWSRSWPTALSVCWSPLLFSWG